MAKRNNTRLKATESVKRGSLKHTTDVPLVRSQCSDQSRSGSTQGLVPVVDANNHPLFPCKPTIAKKLIECKRATPFYKKGFFSIRLNKVISNPNNKRIALAIDPGSKRTGITVATEQEVILNIQCDTPSWIKDKVQQRKFYRHSRRYRNRPYRKCRRHRKNNAIPPSNKAYWSVFLRILNQLSKIIPISDCIFEDVKAKSKKNAKRWNRNFSPAMICKYLFKTELEKLGFNVHIYFGFETKKHRELRHFKKCSSKTSEKWETHCVDSHSLIELLFNNIKINKNIYILKLLRFNRRELHRGKHNGVRKSYGSTRSLGINRGTLINHPKRGLVYVGGSSMDRLSIHDIKTHKRLAKNIKKETCKILTKQSWTTNLITV